LFKLFALKKHLRSQ